MVSKKWLVLFDLRAQPEDRRFHLEAGTWVKKVRSSCNSDAAHCISGDSRDAGETRNLRARRTWNDGLLISRKCSEKPTTFMASVFNASTVHTFDLVTSYKTPSSCRLRSLLALHNDFVFSNISNPGRFMAYKSASCEQLHVTCYGSGVFYCDANSDRITLYALVVSRDLLPWDHNLSNKHEE